MKPFWKIKFQFWAVLWHLEAILAFSGPPLAQAMQAKNAIFEVWKKPKTRSAKFRKRLHSQKSHFRPLPQKQHFLQINAYKEFNNKNATVPLWPKIVGKNMSWKIKFYFMNLLVEMMLDTQFSFLTITPRTTFHSHHDPTHTPWDVPNSGP